MSLTTRSTPFCTPRAQTPQPMSTTSVMPMICTSGLPRVAPKNAPTASGERPLNSPEAMYQQYASIQPVTVV